MNRRNFLQASSAALFVSLGGCSFIPPIPSRPAATSEAALGWLKYENKKYTLMLPRIEMGQGIEEGLKQIACTELEISLSDLEVSYQVTTDMELVKATVGSDSIREFSVPLAQAAATLRDAIAHGTLTGELQVTERPLDELNLFNHKGSIGHSPQIEKITEIITGKPLFAGDIRLPHMLYGRVLRAPSSLELTSFPENWSEKAAMGIAGFAGIVKDPRLVYGQSEGLGILAKTPGALDRLESALNIQWYIEASTQPLEVEGLLRDGHNLCEQTPEYTLKTDDMSGVNNWDVDLTFKLPPAGHNPIETRTAVATVSDTHVELWCGSQDVFYVRNVVCKQLDRDESNVHVHAMRVGGAFGGRTICSVELEAAILAEHIQKPVKVQWTRHQEVTQGFMRPPNIARIRAKSAKGQITHWQHHISSSHILFTNAALPKWMQAITDIFVGDKGVARGALPAYQFEKLDIGYDLTRLPIHTGPWRGLGASPNSLMIESAVDEMAYQTQMDPLLFRLSHLKDPRLIAVLEDVAKRSDWQNRWRANVSNTETQTGIGIAAGIYKDMSYVAVVAVVSVDKNGDVKIKQLYCVHDCGLVINPDRVRAQIEGNLIWGMGIVLSDNQPIENGAVKLDSFGEIELPRISQIPTMEIKLIHSDAAPTGAGETAIVAAPAAIVNAIRNATGIRPTTFPISTNFRTEQQG